MGNLKNLEDHRPDILLAEVAAWLHDAGKLHLGHQAKYLRDKDKSNYYHTKFGPGGSRRFLQNFAGSFPQIQIMREQVSLQEIIRDHHKRDFGNCHVANNVVCLIQRADWLDSEYDRSGIITRGTQAPLVQPTSLGFGVFSVFGLAVHLYKLDKNSETIRKKAASCSYNDKLTALLCSLKIYLAQSNVSSFNQQQRKNFISIIKITLNKAAGDTRYSVNDIALWEHSWSVSVLTKSFVAWGILNDLSWESEIRDGVALSNLIKEHARFTSWFRPQLLPLRIDGLAYLAQSNNIPDLLARRALLTQIYDTLQDILEWEFPLAGEVYRDENGPVFLTFLRDENGQDPIPLSALQLPTDSTGTHVLREAYLRALQTPKQSLENYLRQAVVELSQGDLTLPPEIPLFTYTQKSTKAAGEKSLGDLLADEQKQGLWLQADGSNLQEAWRESQEVWNGAKREEICSVCGLRPQGYGRWLVSNIDEVHQEWLHHYQHNHRPNRPYREKTEEEKKCQVCKAISRKMCGVCLERRVDRAKTWVQGVHKSSQKRFWNSHPETVWLDEVADANGRLALIVGYFPLEHWLDGVLVESLAMFKQKATQRGYGVIPDGKVNRQILLPGNRKPILGPKPVSYSRLRRIWETTRRFWQNVVPTDVPPEELRNFCNRNGLNIEDLWEGPLSLEESVAGKAIGEKRSRIFLKAENADALAEHLGPFHAYEMVVQGRKVAVLWVPPEGEEVEGISEEYRGGFWVIENLAYLAGLFGKPFAQVLQEGAQYEIHEPSEYGRPGRATARFTLTEKNTNAPGYTPLIPILAEPRTFMALVPADKALDVVRAIKTKYEREMGKVRNRLPLHLGIVFSDSHQPLRTILDAGRRMLEQTSISSEWEVVSVRKQPDNGGIRPHRFTNDAGGQFAQWFEVDVEKDGRKLTWYIPAMMGDGQTSDNWYPYVFWQKDKDNNNDPSSATQSRIRYYQAPNPFDPDQDGNPQPGWLVHSEELQGGDIIYFTPATFDFIWLDHGGTRFEIAYDQSGQRRGTLRRPHLLDELDDLIACWEMLKQGLGARQIHQVRDLVEAKRAEWFETPEASLKDPTFETFCRDVLANAEWKPGYQPDLDRLTHWAVTGLLADAVELFYHIMKQRPA